MHLEKKGYHINNKNVVNVIVNTTKPKQTMRAKARNNSYESSSGPNIPFNNSSDLQHEILRQSLNDSPQINRPPQAIFKIRDGNEASFISEGNPSPQVKLEDEFDDIFSRSNLQKASKPLLFSKPRKKVILSKFN